MMQNELRSFLFWKMEMEKVSQLSKRMKLNVYDTLSTIERENDSNVFGPSSVVVLGLPYKLTNFSWKTNTGQLAVRTSRIVFYVQFVVFFMNLFICLYSMTCGIVGEFSHRYTPRVEEASTT